MDMSDLVDAARESEHEKQLKEDQGENYKPPYCAVDGGSARHTRIEFIASDTHGKKCGFIMQYIHLDPVDFIGDSVITINYKHEVIVIKGRNLGKLLSNLKSETLSTIRVFNDRLYRNESREGDAFIEHIQRMKIQNGN